MKSSWKKVSLGELQNCGLADLQTGPFGTVLKASEYTNNGVPVISVGEIREGFLRVTEHTPRVNQEITSRLSKYVLESGDIVFGRKGAINRNSIINEKQNGWFLGSDGIRLRLNKEINSSFVSYQLRSSAIGKWLLQSSTGSIMPSLNQKILDRLPLWLPDLTTQNQIASFLLTFDAKIDLNNRINAELETMAKLLYDYWFVQFDFPFDFAQGKPNAHGKPYKSSGGKMVYNERLKREIPEGWEVKKLSSISNITMGQSPSGSSYNDEGLGEIFFQGSTDFGWRFPTIRQYTTEPSRMAKVGDILLSVRAPVGTLNIADNDCCIGRGLAALNSKSGYNSYLYYVMVYFKKIFDHRNNSGTTFGSITKDDLFSLELVVPDDGLLKKYDTIVSKYNEMILNNHKQNQQLAELRDWLLPMLMNGQVKVQ